MKSHGTAEPIHRTISGESDLNGDAAQVGKLVEPCQEGGIERVIELQVSDEGEMKPQGRPQRSEGSWMSDAPS
jgi:hypothetical protein